MKKEFNVKFEKLNKQEKEVAEKLIRLEVTYSEQKEPKKEVRNLFEKAWSLLFDGSFKAAVELLTTIIKAIKSGSDPP